MKGIMMSRADFSDRTSAAFNGWRERSSRPVRRAGFRYCFRATGKNASRNSRRNVPHAVAAASARHWLCGSVGDQRRLDCSRRQVTIRPGLDQPCAGGIQQVNAHAAAVQTRRTAPRGGYLLASDQSLMEDYRRSLDRIAPAFAELKGAIKDNPAPIAIARK